MPIDPRQFALTSEGRQAERFADLERGQRRIERSSLNSVAAGMAIVQAPVQGIAHNTPTLISFNTVVIDTAGAWNPALPQQLTAPRTGVYQVSTYVEFAGNSTGERLVVLGSSIANESGAAILTSWMAAPSTPAVLTAGQAVTVSVLQNSGVTLNVNTAKLAIAWLGTVPS